MGLLDQILGGAMGQQANAAGGQGGLLPLVLQLVNNYPGGLQGLLAQLGQGGLAQQVQSWVGTGQNMPVSADQLMQALGGGQLGALAQQFGMSADQAAGGMAGLLPDVIDKLTPSGAVQDGDIAAGLEMLKGRFLG